MAIALTVAEKIRRWHRAGTTRRQLNALDDAQLADIGLERGQIGAVTSGLMARRDGEGQGGNAGEAARQDRAASVERGMNLSPLFHAYLPRIGH